LGAEVPPEVDEAGCGDEFRVALDISRGAYEHLTETYDDAASASYALCLAYRLRYVLDLNAREAMHLCELRSGSAGHPSYRAVAQEMHRLIAGVHPTVAATFTHMDHSTDARLERITSEIRNENRQAARA
jgi:thymidylate synthase ThyX